MNRKELRTGLMILFTVTVGLLMVFELYLRLTFKVHEPSGCIVYDQKRFWAGRPSCGEYNNAGFRDYQYSYDKSPGVFRIVIIGDSVVEGHGVELSETFGKVLESKLNRDLAGQSYEVILLSMTGYATVQELVLLEEESLRYDPDVILWNYVLNDPANPVYHELEYNAPRYGFQSKWYRPSLHSLAFLKKRFFFLKQKVKGRNCPEEYHAFMHCVYRDEVVENIGKIATFSRDHNIPVIFVINPVYHKGAYKRYPLHFLHQELKEMAESKGLVVYDILNYFSYMDVSSVGIWLKHNYDIWHPSASGHREIAYYLYNKLTIGN